MAQLKARWALRLMKTVNGEPGQGLAEYALILAFIALACVAALGALGQGIANSPGFSLF
jgi:Flp pilus assembly pilin Flp